MALLMRSMMIVVYAQVAPHQVVMMLTVIKIAQVNVLV